MADAEVDIEGINNLTMTNTKKPLGHRRNASWAHAELPSIMYDEVAAESGDEDGDGEATTNPTLLGVTDKGRTRSYSDGALTAAPLKEDKKEKTLAYWRLEKELRLAKDTLLLKVEQCDTLEQYKEKLTAELDDLATSVFEEAHEMIRVEKEARFLSDKRWAETKAQNDVLLAEVKALKAVVEHSMLEHSMSKNIKGNCQSKGKARRSFRWRPANEPTRLRSRSSDDLLEVEAVAVRRDQVEQTVDSRELDMLGEWRDAGYRYDHAWMQDRARTDVAPCLSAACYDPDQQAALLACIQDNALVIEEHITTVTRCELAHVDAACTFRIRMSPTSPWLAVCERTRNQLVALCNLFTYTSYLQKGLVTGEDVTVLIKLRRLLLGVHQARLQGTLLV
eukprot:m.87364 g.87364  ORF g.87364 m.87364 type:complete len:393 (+) comp14774_c0_seq1:218-1396(+)